MVWWHSVFLDLVRMSLISQLCQLLGHSTTANRIAFLLNEWLWQSTAESWWHWECPNKPVTAAAALLLIFISSTVITTVRKEGTCCKIEFQPKLLCHSGNLKIIKVSDKYTKPPHMAMVVLMSHTGAVTGAFGSLLTCSGSKLRNCHHFCRYLGNVTQRKATISNMNAFPQIYNWLIEAPRLVFVSLDGQQDLM